MDPRHEHIRKPYDMDAITQYKILWGVNRHYCAVMGAPYDHDGTGAPQVKKESTKAHVR